MTDRLITRLSVTNYRRLLRAALRVHGDEASPIVWRLMAPGIARLSLCFHTSRWNFSTFNISPELPVAGFSALFRRVLVSPEEEQHDAHHACHESNLWRDGVIIRAKEELTGNRSNRRRR